MKSLLKTRSDKTRFLKKIGFTLDCWIWDAATNNEGYGVFRLNEKGAMAHRVSFSLFHNREVKKGLVIDHICKNRKCVNPFHLREVTQAENLINSNSVSTINSKREKCKNGHNFDAIYKGTRKCNTCSRKRAKEWTKERRKRAKNSKDEK